MHIIRRNLHRRIVVLPSQFPPHRPPTVVPIARKNKWDARKSTSPTVDGRTVDPRNLWNQTVGSIREGETPDVLFDALEKARLKCLKDVHRIPSESYAIVVRHLCFQHDYKQAQLWWDKLRQTKVISHGGIVWGIWSLVINGRLREVFELFESMHAFKTRYDHEQHDDDTPPPPELVFPHNQGVEVYMLVLFQALQHCDRPDLVFGLWDCMETLYDVSPNEILLSQLVRAAVVAINLDDSLEPVERPDHVAQKKNTLSREQARDDMLRMIQEPRPTKIRWKNSHPGLVARQIWRRAIILHNPSLVDVRSPVLTTGPYDGAVSAATFERIATFRLQRIPEEKAKNSMSSTFYQYIMLLESMSLLAEVPLILAWMHACNEQPSRKLLAIAHRLCYEFGSGESKEKGEILSEELWEWMSKHWENLLPEKKMPFARGREIPSNGKHQAGQDVSPEMLLPKLDPYKAAKIVDGAE
jgi:hypothetical protein